MAAAIKLPCSPTKCDVTFNRSSLGVSRVVDLMVNMMYSFSVLIY